MMSTTDSCSEIEELLKLKSEIVNESCSQLPAKCLQRATTDSQATYCSEVEELLKLATDINNKSCSQLPRRRSQRLSQKCPNSDSFSWNNYGISSTGKLFRRSYKKKPYARGAVKRQNPQTQEIFCTQDLREAQDTTFTDLTCNQPRINDTAVIYANNEPLNLSKKVFTNTDLLKPQDLVLNHGLNCYQQSVITLNENVPIQVPSKDVHLDLSMKSKVFVQETSSQNLKEELVLEEELHNTSGKPLNDNEKDKLLLRYDNRGLAPLKVTTQDIQQTVADTNVIDNTKIVSRVELTPQPINTSVPKVESYTQDFQTKPPSTYHPNSNNLPFETKKNLHVKQIEPNKKVTRRGRRRKLSPTAKKNPTKILKKSEKTETTTMNYLPINEFKYSIQNTPKTTQESSNKSILPDVYPPHFKHQLPPEAVLNCPLFPQPTMITPDDTPSCDWINSTSTSPSLPDSLRGIFDTDDIKDILNIEKVSYRLYDYHVQALAVILNVHVQYLTDILDKVVQTKSNVLKIVDKVIKIPFTEDRDLFATTPDGTPPSDGDMVPCSQSPNTQRLFLIKKRN